VTNVSEQYTPETALPKTESHDPKVPEAWSAFMRTGWGDRELDLPAHPITPWAERRRAALAEVFPGERLVLPSGTYKVRSYDTDYRFRSDTAHTYFCGNQTSDAVLVLEDGESVLYARPRSSRETDEFFRDRQYGELWAGRRPSLHEISTSLGLEVRHIDDLPAALSGAGKTRVHRGLSETVDKLVAGDTSLDEDFARVISMMRLLKDEWEVAQLQEACDITTLGFEDSVRDWDQALQYGERWLEGTFFRRARAMGNDIGYDSIVAAAAGALRPRPRGPGGGHRGRAPRRTLHGAAPGRDGGAGQGPRRPRPAAGVARRGTLAREQGLLALDAPRRQPHARDGRP